MLIGDMCEGKTSNEDDSKGHINYIDVFCKS